MFLNPSRMNRRHEDHWRKVGKSRRPREPGTLEENPKHVGKTSTKVHEVRRGFADRDLRVDRGPLVERRPRGIPRARGREEFPET